MDRYFALFNQLIVQLAIPVNLAAFGSGALEQVSLTLVFPERACSTVSAAMALEAAQIAADDVVIQGLEHELIFAKAFLATRDQQTAEFDRDSVKPIVVRQAMALIGNASGVGAFLLECRNLMPFAQAIPLTTARPVYHLLNAATWMMTASGSAA